ncbi:unnamed protein product [Cuscuta epithymum]|uniref:Uncharacterized protein n=1 Tax=Cuscuta epithymum TaxID=186058 RepID=A0AAV0FYU8_9ASTE|nr:unnamed protein product [Cuscuta epithymum]
MSEQSSNSDWCFDIKELLEIRTRCRELRKEKDLLRDSQMQSFEIIRKLEEQVQTLSCAHVEDKKRIQELERELNNCSQEIDYLQDQLTLSNSDKEVLEEETGRLKEELEISKAEGFMLLENLESKELELQSSSLLIEKLEESISCVGLDYQCEIESLKLDLTALDQNCLEHKKSQEQTAQRNASFHDFQLHFQNTEDYIDYLEKENAILKEQLQTCEKNVKVFCQNVEEQFPEWIITGHEEVPENNASSCGDILGPLLTKLAVLGASTVNRKDETNTVSHQIQRYESLLAKLKEELKLERLKAKEEAEDLAQEMAELRYHMMGLLEEEQKRRVCIEQLSLLRISKLEAQLDKERKKSDEQELVKTISTSEFAPEA